MLEYVVANFPTDFMGRYHLLYDSYLGLGGSYWNQNKDDCLEILGDILQSEKFKYGIYIHICFLMINWTL